VAIMTGDLLLTTLNLCLGGLVFLLGLLIFRENPGQRLNRLVALMLFFGGFGAVLAALALMASRATTAPIGAKAVSQMIQGMGYVWEFYFPRCSCSRASSPRSAATRGASGRSRSCPWSLGFGVLVFAPHVFHFALTIAVTYWHPS
jgi:hypothetical protein